MRLLNVTLHPFGHFIDESWGLAKPLVVVLGPNERGKSTLRQAISHALFTPTALTPSKLKETVGPWLPLPSGDHAKVTLTFDHGGSTWTLEKRWGAGQASRLSDGITAIADPATVQAKLGDMLAHGEATFRHVLFTGQAELEQTLTAIKTNAGTLRDIRDVLKAAGGAAADIDEQKLRRLLEKKIKEIFGRWEDDRGAPERQNRQERGIDNPWINGAGDIVKAWYAWQTHEARRREVLTIETDIDRVAAEVATIEQVIRNRDAFVAKYGGLRTGLSERGELEERVKRLAQQVAALQAAFTGWPTAQAGIDAWNKMKPGLETQLSTLRNELATARAKQAGVATTAAFARIEQAKKAWDDAEAEAAKHPSPGNDVLGEIKRLEEAIAGTDNKLAARTMSWRIQAAASRSATIVRGNASPETVTVGPDPASGTAQGRVQITVDGITFTVEGGEDDVEALFRTAADDRARLAKRLAACGADSPEAARRMAEKHRDLQTTAANAKQLYAGLLQDKTFPQWQEAVQSITTLAGTRDIDTIENAINATHTLLSDGEAEAGKHDQSITDWKNQFANHATVGQRLLADQSELAKAKELLTAVPSLPTEFETVGAFLEAIDKAQADQTAVRDELKMKENELTRLVTQLADRRSEDLAEEAEAARRTFERARAKGRDYLRIRDELDRIAAGGGDDPLTAFGAKVADLFSRITGKAAALAFDGQLPARVERGGVEVPPERLSHGAGGALALALRLTMAEAYLDGGAGFIMLDDPLVNLDQNRMAEAADILRAFSARSQVIFLTCHDHHAARLEPPTTAGRASE